MLPGVAESPSSLIDPAQLLGQRLVEVTTAWFEFEERRSLEPVHVWLRWHGTGWCMAHTTGADDLALSQQAPYESYDMAENGRVVVEPGGGPASLVAAVGGRLGYAQRLWQQ